MTFYVYVFTFKPWQDQEDGANTKTILMPWEIYLLLVQTFFPSCNSFTIVIKETDCRQQNISSESTFTRATTSFSDRGGFNLLRSRRTLPCCGAVDAEPDESGILVGRPTGTVAELSPCPVLMFTCTRVVPELVQK